MSPRELILITLCFRPHSRRIGWSKMSKGCGNGLARNIAAAGRRRRKLISVAWISSRLSEKPSGKIHCLRLLRLARNFQMFLDLIRKELLGH